MAKRPWYERFRSDRRARQARQADTPDLARRAGAGDYLGTEAAQQYLLANLRTNAPGFDEQSPLALSRAYSGITYLAVSSFASQAGQAEVELFEHDPDDPDSKEPVSHLDDAAQLVAHPNPDDTFGELLEQIALQFKLTGTACVWVPHDVEDPHDLPREAYVLSTASLMPQPVGPEYPHGAYLVQPWYPAGAFASLPQSRGLGAVVPAEQIVRIRDPHPFFRWTGFATLTGIAAQMDAARMIDLTRSNHMARGFDPSAVISFDPQVQRPDEPTLRRFEAQLQAIHQGPQNAGRIVVAPHGASVETFGHTPSEMAYESGWQQLRDFALAAFRLNAGVAGMVDGLSYATLYASLRWFYIFGLRPFLTKVAASWTRHVLHPFFGRHLLLELEGASITDEDLQERQIGTMCTHNLARVGELRRLYKLPPSDRDDEWVMDWKNKQGSEGGPEGGPGGEPGDAGGEGEANPLAALLGGGNGPQEPDDKEMARKRPPNPEGRGSLGPRMPGSRPGGDAGPERKSLTPGERGDRIGAALERALSNGIAHQHRGSTTAS